MCVFSFIAFFFIAYSVFKIIRRKFTKPNFKDKNVWITGASSGIGQYLAYQFSKAGANLILSARNLNELERVKNNCQNSQNVEIIKLDMTKFQQVAKTTKNLIQIMQKKGKKLDVVVENAGVSMRCQFKDYPFQNHINMFDLNVHGPYNHIQTFIQHMIKNKSGQIVGITSVAGKLGAAYRSSYAGTKHAFIGILDCLRTQFSPYNITVTNIMPGYVKTKISQNAFGAEQGKKFGKTDTNIGGGMDPQKFAKQSVRAIYNRQKQVQISESWMIPLGIQLRNSCPDLAFYFLKRNQKNQSKAVKQAKKNQ